MTTNKEQPSIQDVQQYWNNRPCNIRHSPKEVGSKEYFDEVEQRKYFVEPHIPRFAEFSKWKDKSVLEIGCGIGTDAVNFARAGALYTGLELSQASLDITKQRFNTLGLEGYFIQANGEDLSSAFTPNTFDFVYSFGVIHHTPNPDKIISEITKVLKPDGELRIMLYAKNSWKSHMIDAGLDQPEAQYGCPIANTYDEYDVKKLLKGFEITSITQDHIFPYQVDAYKKHQYIKEEWFQAMPEPMFRALELRLGWHMLIKAKPIKKSE